MCVSVWLALSVFVHLRLFIFKLFIAHCFFRFSRSGIQNINCFSFGSFYLLLFLFLFYFCAIFLFWSGEIAACNIYTCTKYCMKSKLFVLKSFCITVSTYMYSIYLYIFLFFCLQRVQIYVHLNAVSLLLLLHLELANF